MRGLSRFYLELHYTEVLLHLRKRTRERERELLNGHWVFLSNFQRYIVLVSNVYI